MPPRTLLASLLCLPLTLCAQGGKKAAPTMTDAAVLHQDRVYKATPQGKLELHLSLPADWKPADKRPAILFFFGGGWKNGSYTQFVSQSDYFASRGLVAASADYRIESKHKTKPDKCVEDAKSAMRYLRAHAAELGIDPTRIIASGGSAGGHLAACTALIEDLNAETDDLSISAKPSALVLFNPALNIDELAAKRGDKNFTLMAEKITPNRYISAQTPPAIMFFGTDDELIDGARKYVAKASSFQLRAELWTAADQAHGFFNRAPWTQVTTRKADEFLISLGYLTGSPTLPLPSGAPELVKE